MRPGIVLLFCIFFLIGFSLSAESVKTKYEDDPYEMIRVVFIGNPSKNAVQPMMERIMLRYGMRVSRDNILKVASMLLDLRKASAVGVTEMEILKHMYQKGSSTIKITEQAAISSLILEKLK